MNDKKNYGFPDPMEKDSVKREPSYGLKVAKAIEQEWFNGGTVADNTEYGSRRAWIRNNRLFVRGEQDQEPYKKHMARVEGDLEYLNLDWRPLNIAEKFCNIVANGINENYYKLDIRAIDKLTAKLKSEKEAYYKKQMRSRELFKNMKEAMGIDLSPSGYIPEDDEELALMMEIKERPKIEIAEELIIDYVKKSNDWKNIEEQKNQDLVINGIGVVRIDIDPVNGVEPYYVDPEYFIHSKVTKNDFSDAHYWGEVDSMTISDLRRESGYDDMTLRKIAKSYARQNNFMSPSNFDNIDFREIADIKVDVLRFTFKTTKRLVYKKTGLEKGRTKVSRKDDDYNPPKRSDYERIDGTYYTFYQGNYIVGTDYIYDYKESENIVRDERDRPIPRYRVRATNIYKNRLHSFLENIKALVDQMQYIHLKMQHLLAELKPDLINIDLDQLAELGDGEGGAKQEAWKMALNFLNVKGVTFSKRNDLGELGVKEGQAARPIPMNQGSGLPVLLNSWAHYYNLIREITGINPVRDGSQPHDSLVGTNEMALLASNTSTQHIVDAAMDLNKKVAECISARIHGIFSHRDAARLRKMYTDAVGKHLVDALELLKDRNLHDFGFVVEMNPSNEEVKSFKEDLQIAMQEGYIDVEDKMECENIAKSSFKMAREYMMYRRRKRKKEKSMEMQAQAQLQAQSNSQAAIVAEEAKVKSYRQMAGIDIQKEQALLRLELIKKQAESELRKDERAAEFPFERYLKEMEVAANFELNNFKENRKDDRSKMEATQNSKMIDQRKREAGPIDFESDFDINKFLGG